MFWQSNRFIYKTDITVAPKEDHGLIQEWNC